MKNKNYLLLLLAIFSIALHGNSQTEDAQEGQTSFNLEEVKIYALDHHLNVKNALNEIEIANQQLKETRGIGLPQVNINGSFNQFINQPTQVLDASFFNPNAQPGETIAFQAGTEFTSGASLDASQIVFNGSYIVALQVASFFTSFQETASQLTKEDVVFNAIQAYQLTSVAKLNMIFADSVVNFTQKLVNQQGNYFELGMLLQEDMDQLNYSLLQAKNTLVSAELNYHNALNMLKLSMGYPMMQDIEIKETPNDLMDQPSLYSERDIHNNLSYVLSQKKVKLSEYNLKNDKFAYLPSVNAFFQQSYNAYRTEFNFFADEKWYPQTVWGLQMSIPVFSGGQRHYKIKKSEISLMIDENKANYVEQSLLFYEIRAKNNLTAAQDKLELQKENIALARSIYINTQAKESIGKGNSIIVTQKYNQLLFTQTLYIQSLVQLFQAKLELDKIYNNILPK